MYNKRFFRPSRFNLAVISIGNLNVGGTGKTPLVEYIIDMLRTELKVAVISRGYGRKKRGFHLAGSASTVDDLGDEPMQYHTKFGDEISVAVEPNRVKGVMNLMVEKPETELVILDDAFQHRAIYRGVDILLTSIDDLFFDDFILPVGNLRESRSNGCRADIFIVTKCPDFLRATCEPVNNKLRKFGKPVFFTSIGYAEIRRIGGPAILSDLVHRKVILVTGIANSGPLLNHIKKSADVLRHFRFRDHHRFRLADVQEIHSLFDTFAAEDPVILTTEKDAMRLSDPELGLTKGNYPWYFQKIETVFERPEEFRKIITGYVETNC